MPLFICKVISVIEDKDKEIAVTKANMKSKQVERLNEKLVNLKAKMKAEKVDLGRKLKEAALA